MLGTVSSITAKHQLLTGHHQLAAAVPLSGGSLSVCVCVCVSPKEVCHIFPTPLNLYPGEKGKQSSVDQVATLCVLVCLSVCVCVCVYDGKTQTERDGDHAT